MWMHSKLKKYLKPLQSAEISKEAEKFAAAEDKEITTESLLQEILPLLEDHFICDLKEDGLSVRMDFKNGQRFRLIFLDTD